MQQWRIRTRIREAPPELALTIDGADEDSERLTGTAALSQSIQSELLMLLGCCRMVAGIEITQPKRSGRRAIVAAAYDRFGRPAIVVDFGSSSGDI